MRQKYLILLALMIITSMLFFYLSGKSINSKINKISIYDKRIKKEQEKLNSAKVLNEQLQQISKVIVNSMTSEAKYTPEEINAFIKKLADLADKYKIAVHSIFPKVISSIGHKFIQQQYTMELNCTFVQMGQFLTDLESFDRIMKIKTLDICPISGEEKKSSLEEKPITRYKVTLELSTFKIMKEA
ncbi:MAG: type 4a pilus biogenesis protein PilO [Candidatus Cloacimonetes bacterium]|nr:type 4a pilus biogenesis protein PilO [Candidatus Cloacimonadota bacterium]MBL7086191.1 type 4a pilus biogenesis protein PilO [Candidatus Cloacimonadota bacterium]